MKMQLGAFQASTILVRKMFNAQRPAPACSVEGTGARRIWMRRRAWTPRTIRRRPAAAQSRCPTQERLRRASRPVARARVRRGCSRARRQRPPSTSRRTRRPERFIDRCPGKWAVCGESRDGRAGGLVTRHGRGKVWLFTGMALRPALTSCHTARPTRQAVMVSCESGSRIAHSLAMHLDHVALGATPGHRAQSCCYLTGSPADGRQWTASYSQVCGLAS